MFRLVFLFLLPWCATGATTWTTLSTILAKADAQSPPPTMGNPEALNVQLGVSVKSMKYDIMDAHLTIEYWLRLAWLDTRLNFTGADTFGPNFNPDIDYLPVKVVHGDVPNIWVPDVSCFNASDSTQQPLFSYQAFVYAQEHVTAAKPYNVMLSRAVTMRAYCKPQLSEFPFDAQTCNLNFGSWAYANNYIKMSLMETGFQKIIAMPDSNEYTWTRVALGEDFSIVETGYEAIGGGWSEAVMAINLQRLPMYYMLNAILPMFMMVIVSTFAFWIPINPSWPGSGERMGFSITCLLTIVAVGLFTADKRPMVGETTWLDRWISWCLVLTSVPIVETIFVFFLDAIFRNMEETATRENAPAVMRHTSSKYDKYAAIVAEAKTNEAHRSKKVVKVVLVLKAWCPCIFFNPRCIDIWCRHLFPVICVGRLGFLLAECADHWGTWSVQDSEAFYTIFGPFAGGSVLLLLGGIVWLIYANHLCCSLGKKHYSEAGLDDSSDDDADEEEDHEGY